MRHRKKINHLGRKSQHRQAMLSNMASSLILHKRIFTTVAKAKALRVYVEPLITKSKEDSTHSRRTVFAYLQNKHAVSELFREVSQKISNRPGGYTRILKTGFRPGDAAEMCFIELVDYNTNMLKTTEDSAKRTRRSRRGKKSSDASPKAKAATPKTEEKPVDEVAEKAEETKETNDVDVTDATPEQADAAAEVKAEDTKDVEEKAETKEEEKEEPKAEKKEESKVEEKEEPKAEAKDNSKTEGDDSADDDEKKDDK